MFLKKLEIHGFKSFAEKTILDFESKGDNSKITGIVGPNGSGKSNVVDAIRWVLGEQSYKLLRSKKSEDVVFFGSAKRQRGGAASVSIFLDNSKKQVPLEFQEIAITRKVYGSGENEYLINNSKVRLIDVHELLSRCGFGQTTYTVIGQGTVDQMLFYGPTERKVLFDEAAGVKKYQIKREQAFRKLEGTEKNLIRLRDILTELTPRVENLRRLVKRAEGRKELEEELSMLQNTFYGSLFFELENKNTTLKKSKEIYLKKIKEIEDFISKLNKEISEKSKENPFSKEKNDLNKKIQELFIRRDELLKKVSYFEGQIDHEKSAPIKGGYSVNDLKKEESRLKEKKEFLLNKVSEGEKDIENLKKLIEGLEEEKNKLSQKMILTERNIEELKDSLDEKELKDLTEKLNSKGNEDLRKEFLKISTLKKNIKETLNSEKIDIENLKRNFEEFDKAFSVFSKKIEETFLKENNDEEKRLKESLDELRSKQNEISKLASEKEILKEKISEFKIEMNKNEAHIQSRKHIIENQKRELEFTEEELTNLNLKIDKSEDLESDKVKELKESLKKEEKDLLEKEKELILFKSELSALEENERNFSKVVFERERDLRNKESELSNLRQEISKIEIEEAKVDVRKEDLEEETRMLSIPYKKIEIKNQIGQEERGDFRNKIENLKRRLESIGDVDAETKDEYAELSIRQNEISVQVEDLEAAKNDLFKIVKELDIRIKDQFGESFQNIAKEFGRYFKTLFDGGEANISLERSEDLGLAEVSLDKEEVKNFGIEITACPPGKKVKNLNVLSGGERTLTSLALLFAILSVNPSPFVVLDEVDAALDEENTKRFLKIIENLSQKTQFIIITHNKETMKTTDSLYGVTMDDEHISKLLSLKISEVTVK